MLARRWSLLALAVSTMAGNGCSESRQPPPPVDLTRTGACADVFFWAATASGDLAVTVTADARDRSTVDQTTIRVVPDGDDAAIEILQGENLHWNFCNDIISGQAEPTSTQSAASGSGVLKLDPRQPGLVSGSLIITDLEAEDGTIFAPIEVHSDRIGFYAG
jgi:hypothetical protein